MPHSRTVTIHDSLPFKDQRRDECSDSLASLTRSPLSSAGRASDLQAECRGFESCTNIESTTCIVLIVLTR